VLNSARTDDHKLNKYIMLVCSPRPNRIVTGVPDKVGNLCYKVLQYPDALRRAKTPKCGRYVNTRYTNKISTLCIIYHQKGLNEEILDHHIKCPKCYITILTIIHPALPSGTLGISTTPPADTKDPITNVTWGSGPLHTHGSYESKF
jgi:hypothetical protein